MHDVPHRFNVLDPLCQELQELLVRPKIRLFLDNDTYSTRSSNKSDRSNSKALLYILRCAALCNLQVHTSMPIHRRNYHYRATCDFGIRISLSLLQRDAHLDQLLAPTTLIYWHRLHDRIGSGITASFKPDPLLTLLAAPFFPSRASR